MHINTSQLYILLNAAYMYIDTTQLYILSNAVRAILNCIHMFTDILHMQKSEIVNDWV